MLNHIYNFVRSAVRESYKNSPLSSRSDKWPKVEKAMITKFKRCAACGSMEKLQVHHILPFHSHPELELNESNLIILCMSENECHLKIGHGDLFKAYNPWLMKDINDLRLQLVPLEAVQIRAKLNRIKV